jgi:hypothetical protein
MAPGFSFRETMSGNYWRLDAPTEERAIAFTVEAKTDDVRRFARDKTWRITGTIDAEGLASARELDGTLAIKLQGQRRLHYRFTFLGDDEQGYEFNGQKEYSPLALVESMTLLPASLYDPDGEEVARAVLRFDARSDFWRWLRSFRLHLFS